MLLSSYFLRQTTKKRLTSLIFNFDSGTEEFQRLPDNRLRLTLNYGVIL